MHVVAHCRAGFEAECAEDLARVATRARTALQFTTTAGALVVAHTATFHADRWSRALREQPPVFARSVFFGEPVSLGERDRITPIVAIARAFDRPFSAVWLETADTNEGKTLSAFCRRLQPLLEPALVDAGVLHPGANADRRAGVRLHVLFTSRAAAFIGWSDVGSGSAWPMGIPRLRMPHGAPSRSTLKLAEAFLTFLGDGESELLRPGMRAVDLGAAPGGWSWQLAHRGLRVIAVDNGGLKGEAAHDSLVTHVREDGFSYRPRRPVDWMVCDIVEKPSRIAALVARWIASGDARHSIFNLKLPMKRRYDELLRCADIIESTMAQGTARHSLRLRQLYHDREEVTGCLLRL